MSHVWELCSFPKAIEIMRDNMAYDGYDYAAMPKKRLAASALFLNGEGNVLIVKPSYRQDWLLPGGTVEFNESPREACIREVMEELNLRLPPQRLLCIEYHSDDTKQAESVQFVFYGGKLEESQILSLTIPDSELSDYRFSPREEAIQLLSHKLAKRLPYCLQAIEENTTFYIEDGKEP